MATTTFSGPVASTNGFVLETSTAAIIGDVDAAVNTQYKVAGKQVVDLATGFIYTATGADADSPWFASDGATAVTPA
jgi:hypothetical protein